MVISREPERVAPVPKQQRDNEVSEQSAGTRQVQADLRPRGETSRATPYRVSGLPTTVATGLFCALMKTQSSFIGLSPRTLAKCTSLSVTI